MGEVVFISAALRPKGAESDPMSTPKTSSKAIINDSSFWCQVPKECANFQTLLLFVTTLKRKKHRQSEVIYLLEEHY